MVKKKRKFRYTAYRSKNKITYPHGLVVQYEYFYRHDKMKFWEKILYVFFDNNPSLDYWFERVIFTYEE